MAAQDGLYTLVLENPDGTRDARVIGSIVDYLYAPDDPEAVIEMLAAPSTRIVSLTITEGGYNIDGAGPDSVFGLVARRSPVVANAASRRRRSCPATTSRATAMSPASRSPPTPSAFTPASATGWANTRRSRTRWWTASRPSPRPTSSPSWKTSSALTIGGPWSPNRSRRGCSRTISPMAARRWRRSMC